MDVEDAFGPHRGTGHHDNLQKYISADVDFWASHDHVLGDNNSGPWKKSVAAKAIRNEEGSTLGRFGEMECVLDKYICNLAFGKKPFTTK